MAKSEKDQLESSKLAIKQDKIEQNQLKNTTQVTGFPEKSSESRTTLIQEFLQTVTQSMGVQIEESSILDIKRVKFRTTGAEAASLTPKKPVQSK